MKKKQIVELRFKVRLSRADYERICACMAGNVAVVPGLAWKVCTYSEAQSQGGGIFLFESKDAAQTFIDSPIVARLKAEPGFQDFELTTFEVLEAPGMATRSARWSTGEHAESKMTFDTTIFTRELCHAPTQLENKEPGLANETARLI